MDVVMKDLFDPNSPNSIGVDVGGTKINAGIIQQDGTLLTSVQVPTKAKEGLVMDQILEVIQELIFKKEGQVKYRGIGIGTAGQIDFEAGKVLYSNDLIPNYTGLELKKNIENYFNLPTIVDNDVNVLAVAQKYLGSKNSRHLLCLALGTGVGGAVMIDGKLYRGALGGAGEFGHISVNFNGPQCHCGNKGCLEMYASGTGISRILHEKNIQNSGKNMISNWVQGDPVAEEIMKEVIAALGAAISSLIHIFNPETIIIGGGIAEVGVPLFSRLREEVSMRTMPSLLQAVTIEPAVLGNRTGMIGAGLQIWEYNDKK